MDPDVILIPATLAALLGAPRVAFVAEDAALLALLVGLGATVGMVVGAGATRVLRHRRDAARPPADEVMRRPIHPSRVGLPEDPIVVALGVNGDEASRARRRRRRPIGAGPHTPPGESAPPT